MSSENGHNPQDLSSFAQMGANFASDLMETRGLSRAGLQFGGERDIEEALGYTKNPQPEHFRDFYDSRDIASVIVDRPAHDTWRKRPKVKDGSEGESDFIKGWQQLVSQHKIFHYLERLDKLSGIGRYGVLLIGFKDENNNDLSQEISNPQGINYLTPFWEEKAEIEKFETETGEERFGRPTLYDIDMEADIEGFQMEEAHEDVHYSRVIHVAEGLLDNEVYGEPRLQKVFHRLQDLDKLLGAAPEAYWQQAAKGYHVEEKENANLEDEDFDEITDEVNAFLHGFKRVFTTSGVNLNELAGNTNIDPSNPFDIAISVIAAKTGIPKRILTGSERAELASSQDRKNWFDRVEERQNQFAAPMILEKLIDHLVDYNVLTPPKNGGYEVEWPNLWTPTVSERAEIANKRAQALDKASGGQPKSLMDEDEIRKYVFDMEPREMPTEQQLSDNEENEQVRKQFAAAKKLTRLEK